MRAGPLTALALHLDDQIVPTSSLVEGERGLRGLPPLVLSPSKTGREEVFERELVSYDTNSEASLRAV
jgi:hypothetical protein